ncbi:DUF2971 domain-containing protein [Sphingomonas sp. QA11]|uniref:DUF2971 domain-containing protein n=1 Tax=Sphingomonas sp. QA11 TaxID=2950605 RepID=UPI002349F168|nr:DUF2971 domain-containing protein [Sphingomonas sp. QA11]WCM28131.1 DUF2971 domain-containing protein [Sphingomonas sp. QA11]
MTKKIYKYFSSDVLKLAFLREGFCGVKCSLPKDYNDPYELFLGVDLTLEPELLATYRDIIQELLQHPTTCFSLSPTVTPMWAHYGANHSGFILEFDADELQTAFTDLAVRDVMYKDKPDDKIARFLEMAAGTKKPRHAVGLQAAVLSEAYFSKHTSWSYEQECRLVDDSQYCEAVGLNQILFIPITCVSSIIVGKNISDEAKKLSLEIADTNDLAWHSTVIGKSTAQPFFLNRNGEAAVFDGGGIALADNTCSSCSEPVSADASRCPWCSITEAQERNAAMGNPLRMLDRFGLLGDYYASVEAIRRQHQSDN